MITKRRLVLLSSLTAAPAFAAPFLAIGDNAELFLTARTEARYEDNVTLSSSDEQSDEIFEFVPGAEIIFGKNSLTKGSLTVFERFTAYSDNQKLNDELANVIFKTNYDGAKLDLNTNASYIENAQNTRDARGPNLVSRETTTVGADGEYAVTEKSKFGLGAQYSETDYKTAGYTDQESFTVPVDYYFAIRPKIDLSVGVQYRETDVDAVDADSEDFYYNVGARGQFTSKLSGKITTGYTVREPESGDNESLWGLQAGLAYDYSPKTTFTLDLSNDFSTGADAQGSETSSVTLGARSSLTAALSVNGSVVYQQVDYLGSNRNDDYVIGNLGLTYAYNEHLNFDAGYTFSDNSSNSAGASFTANVFQVAANFRY